MDESFVSLADFVRDFGVAARATSSPRPGPAASISTAPQTPAPPARPARAVPAHDEFAHAETLHELTLLRLAAREAFARAQATLLETLAAEVVGRELALAPADLEALAKRALERFDELEPLALAVSPCDAERIRTHLPLRIDRALEAGDFIIDVRDGALESHFTFRLHAALADARQKAT